MKSSANAYGPIPKSLVPIKVLILSFNHPEITKDCVQSTLSFFKEEDIFLVHNGSEKKHIKNIQEKYPKIQHLVIETNRGFTGGVNFGFKHLFRDSTDWVLFLTNDCLLKQINPRLFNESYPPGLLAPKIMLRKTEHTDSLGGEFTAAQGHLSHFKGPATVTHKFYVHGAAFIIHKDFWKQNGEFDESLHSYWEDVDYSMRAHQKGLLLHQFPDVVIAHKVGKTTQGNSFYTTFLFQRNRLIVSRRFLKMQNPRSYYFALDLRLKFNFVRLTLLNLRRGKIKEANYLTKLLLK